MAIYHLTTKAFSRSKGHSAVAAAAYRSGQDLKDERQAKTHYYNNRQGKGVEHSEILAPEQAPDWMKQRESLWNGVEKAEYRRDARVAREVEVALPRELDLEQQKKLVEGFVKEQFVQKGMVADIAIHDAKEGHNPHAHVMLTTRNIQGEGFGKKNTDWNNKKFLNEWRQSWETHVNDALEDSGHTSRVDHRTLKAQGIDRVPDVHRGKDATALIRKNQPTPRIEKVQKAINTNNAFRNATSHEIKQEDHHEDDERSLKQILQKRRDAQEKVKEPEHGDHREKDKGDVQNALNRHRRVKPPKRKLGEWEKYLSEQQKRELQREDR